MKNEITQNHPAVDIPVGILPEWRHKELRIEEINLAMERYRAADYFIPDEWIYERDELFKWLEDNCPSSPYLKGFYH